MTQTMKLSELRAVLDQVRSFNWNDLQISGLTQDSRQVQPGFLFVACPEAHGDGHDYVNDAVRNGAAALVVQRKVPVSEAVPQLVVSDGHLALAKLAAAFYRHPSRRLTLIGVTGTSGKTTTTLLVDSIYQAAGKPIGLLGTITYRIGRREIPANMTTPMANDVQAMLRDMADEGMAAGVMEVSSHALARHRVDGCRFACGIFTNLTHEHLDYHGTLVEYRRAKSLLFAGLDKEAVAVMNADDPCWREVLGKSTARVVTYALDNAADVRGEVLSLGLAGCKFRATTPWGELGFTTALVGRHNIYNSLAAAAACGALGIEPGALVRGVERAKGVPGRLERVEAGQPFVVLVDYAHKEDALRKVLGGLRDLVSGRIILVFGCGGDRDRQKRPLMGKAAEELADFTVVTSDNPRAEEPMAIIDEILGGIGDRTRVAVEPDRAQAIRRALAEAGSQDMVLIAGKGHETKQLFRDRVIPFDDREVTRAALAELGYHR